MVKSSFSAELYGFVRYVFSAVDLPYSASNSFKKHIDWLEVDFLRVRWAGSEISVRFLLKISKLGVICYIMFFSIVWLRSLFWGDFEYLTWFSRFCLIVLSQIILCKAYCSFYFNKASLFGLFIRLERLFEGLLAKISVIDEDRNIVCRWKFLLGKIPVKMVIIL